MQVHAHVATMKGLQRIFNTIFTVYKVIKKFAVRVMMMSVETNVDAGSGTALLSK
jgi:hypothetical protein